MNMYFKVRCILYYSTLLTIIVFVFFLNTGEETEDFDSEVMFMDVGESYTTAGQRMVTKSMADRGKMDLVNGYFLFLNQVPNCGGEFLVLLLQKLQGINSYRHVRLGRGPKILSVIEQEELIERMYKRMRNEAIPLSFDKSVYFVNFTQYDRQFPTHINIIRDPIEKLLSRSNSSRESSLLKCIHMQRKCMIGEEIYEFNIPYFCGQDARCRSGNSEWALQNAKKNVEKFYPVVGVLEELNMTVTALENKLPFFFQGSMQIYEEKLSVLPKLSLKMDAVKRDLLRSVLKTEYEFYEWIKKRLASQING
ncbi:uronyl 2-sulfotransferase-like isoform X2 [Coccinella septempunctata]|uniref:uronyl 2-sulfotransferase-like isoform X2 n=1 Tax=Coccinella septempunctata TaxID=41139 RepID=UPI001D082D18|nr:uronyl 2-sulfotransferase-like isoform X2 [Coccinella septempunctata]